MRWYDPSTGRFLTPDLFPSFAALPQTQHPYVYTGNNPINLTDPSGELAPILVAAGVGGAIGGVVGGISYVIANPGGRPEDYLRSRGFWRSVGIGATSGLVAGTVGWAAPSLLPTASSFWGVVGIGALTGSLAGGAGQLGGIHGSGGFVGPGNVNLPGQWNSYWQAFIDAHPQATAKEAYQFGGYLMDLFGLTGLPIVPYQLNQRGFGKRRFQCQ